MCRVPAGMEMFPRVLRSHDDQLPLGADFFDDAGPHHGRVNFAGPTRALGVANHRRPSLACAATGW